jgi:Ran GTPase-activating protein (RanGAP) involved in mRNA processing and transport
MSEREYVELADALLENTNVTYLELDTTTYSENSAQAMATYVRTSKRLQRIEWDGSSYTDDRESEQCQKMLCYFLPAFQESTSLKELQMQLPIIGDGPSNLAFQSMLAHTKSLQALTIIYPDNRFYETDATVFRSGLEMNTSLRELTLTFVQCEETVPTMLNSICNHPLLGRLWLNGTGVDLTGLEVLLESDTSKITELDIEGFHVRPPLVGLPRVHDIEGLHVRPPTVGLQRVLQALARRPTLTKLGLHCRRLDQTEARLLRLALCSTPRLQTLVLVKCTLGSADLAELAPELYSNTSIKVLDISDNGLDDLQSAKILQDILRLNKTMTALDVSQNKFGLTAGAVECIAEGMSENSTLLKLNLSNCHLGDGGLSTLAQSLGSRDTTLQKLSLARNSITHMGVGVLLETMEQNSYHITDLDLGHNRVRNEGASILARALANDVLRNLTHLSLPNCGIGDDGFITLVSALKQNTSLLQLDLRYHSTTFSERAFLLFADSLPEIKVLQRVDFHWCTELRSAMPQLLTGWHKNTSLLHLSVAGCAPSFAPPTPRDTEKCAGCWMQEKERLGYRNRFLLSIRTSNERPPPRYVWPHALAQFATYPDVIFEVLSCTPSLVPSSQRSLVFVPSAERLKPRGCWSRSLAWLATLINIIFEVQSQT